MMHTDFAIAVDPIFDRGLQAIVDIDRGLKVEAQSLHVALLNLFDRADAILGDAVQWQLAKYAMAAWIDEMLLHTPWDGARWWSDHILEMEFFQTRICSVRFYELAHQASADTNRDALEVFVNCVQLGFRGILGPGDRPAIPLRTDGWVLPGTIDEWLKQMEPRLDVQGTRRRAAVVAQYPQRIIEGAPPLPAGQIVIWWSLAAAVLLLVNGWAFQSLAFHWSTER